MKLKRQDQVLPIENYAQYFLDQIRRNRDAVFHNADIYPEAYDTVHAITYLKTDAPMTVKDRLIPTGQSYRLNRFVYWVVSEWPFGKAFREHAIDPLLFRGESVTSRNHQSSYDVAELEPASRTNSTYAAGGSYYLPYQLHATDAQFRRAYPRAAEFFVLKGRLDPTNKFRNELWNKYYHP